MSIANITYVDPTRKSDGPKQGGMAWLPVGLQDFTGWVRGDLVYAYTYELYAGPDYWGDGSTFVLKDQKQMEPWRLRNAIRSVKAEFLAVKRALEAAGAEEIGGVAVVDPNPAWLDAPMERDPSLPPDPEA